MKRVIIVPVTETRQFPGMKILARGGSIAALVGDTFEERTRSAFDSEDSFFYSVADGRADLYTFHTLEEAARFAKGKLGAGRGQHAETRSNELVLAPAFSQQFLHSFQAVPVAIGTDASGVSQVDFCTRKPSIALFLPFQGVGPK